MKHFGKIIYNCIFIIFISNFQLHAQFSRNDARNSNEYLSQYQRIEAGVRHTAELRGGELWVWGNNQFGQLGTGDSITQTAPVRVGTSINWVFVSAGENHTLGIRSDGTLWAWGQNQFGQVGDGSTVNRLSPVQIGSFTDWISISAGNNHNLAIRADGTLWSWGKNDDGQLGQGTSIQSNSPVQIGSERWFKVSAGGSHSLALRSNGTLWAWGNNSSGQIGNSSNLGSSIPVQVGTDTNWKMISAGDLHSLGIRANGTLWAWGNNTNGRLGDGTSVNRNVPTQVGTSNLWISASAGGGHTLGLRVNGTLWAWGNNSNGEFGNNTTTSSNVPLQIGTSNNWVSISTGGNFSFTGSANGILLATGNNQFGQLGDGTTTSRNAPVQVSTLTTWVSMSTGLRHTLALKSDGTLFSWGDNISGQLGDGTTTQRSFPIQVGSSTNWVSVSAGELHTHAIKSDGTLWAWGFNGYGQLGDGTIINRISPIQVGVEANWLTVAAGRLHTLAIKSDGTLWAWGANEFGTLGIGTNSQRNNPVQVGTSTNWISVSTRGAHTLAIKSDGTLWSWGHNGFGELGDGSTANRNIPIQIGIAANWLSVSAGLHHSIAIKSDGTVMAWGYNWRGQLGDGTTIDRSIPSQVGVATNWVKVFTGDYHTLAIKSDGSLWSWGHNAYGQLGDGTYTNRLSPVQIGFNTDNLMVSGGSLFSTLIKADRQQICGTGENYYGQIGNGTTYSPGSFVCHVPVVLIASITSNTPVCSGNSLSLTASDYPIATTYAWTGPNGFTANTRTISISNATTNMSGVYTLQVTQFSNTTVVYHSVNVFPAIQNNVIGSAQTICSGNLIASISGSIPSGGTGTYSFLWQSSSDNQNWNSTGISSSDYPPTSILTTVWFRRLVVSGCTLVSTASQILMHPQLSNNLLTGTSVQLCVSNPVYNITASVPQGGGGSSYNYQWQSSSDNSSWTSIIGQTNQNTTSDTLRQTTWFRRIVSCNNCINYRDTSLSVQRILTPIVTNNSIISPSQTVCGSVTLGLSGTLPSGGTGVYAYLWETSSNGSIWASSGVTTQNYPSTTLTASRWFRRRVTSGCISDSPVLSISVISNITQSLGFHQTVCENNPVYGQISSPPSGGGGGYSYIWESSIDNSNWNSIPGQTNQALSSDTLRQTTWFRRIVSDIVCLPNTSNAFQRILTPIVINNSIISPSQTVCGSITLALSGTLPSGGSGVYTYLWETSSNGSIWASSGVTTQNYPSTTLTASRWFRRRVTSGCISDSPVLSISVLSNITQSLGSNLNICATNPVYSQISSPPSGGGGGYSYIWESSIDNSNWNSIPGQTNQALSSDTLRQTTWFRRIVSDMVCLPNTSNPVQRILTPIVTNNSIISPSQTVCGSGTISLSGSLPSGGNGTYTYSWRSSANGFNNWTSTGITTQNYPSTTFTSSRWFQRTVSSGACSSSSGNVSVIVLNNLTNSIITSNQSICEMAGYPPITGSITGGSGSFSYSWQSSTDNSSWAIIPGQTAQTLPSDTLRQTTWFRRIVSDSVCTQMSTSTSVRMYAYPPITNNIISGNQTACSRSGLNLSGTMPSGGSGNYWIYWQSSTDGITFNFDSYPGATSGFLRRYVSSGGCTHLSNVIPVQVVIPHNILGGGGFLGHVSDDFSNLNYNGLYCYGVLDTVRPINVQSGNHYSNATYSWEVGNDTLNYNTLSNSNISALPWSRLAVPDTYAIRRIVQIGQCRDTSNWGGLVVHPQIFSNLLDTLYGGPLDNNGQFTNPPDAFAIPASGGSGNLSVQGFFATDYHQLPYVYQGHGQHTRPGYYRRIVTDQQNFGFDYRDWNPPTGPHSTHIPYINLDHGACQDTGHSVLIDTSTFINRVNEVALSGRPEVPANSLIDSISGPFIGFPGVLTFQWQSRPLNSSSFTNISGGTQAALTNFQVQQSACFRRLITYQVGIDTSDEVCVQVCTNSSVSVDTNFYYQLASSTTFYEQYQPGNPNSGAYIRKYYRNGIHLPQYDGNMGGISVYPPFDSSTYYFVRDSNIVCGGYIESAKTVFYSSSSCADNMIRLKGNHKNFRMCFGDTLQYELDLPPNCVISQSSNHTWSLIRFSPAGVPGVHLTSNNSVFIFPINGLSTFNYYYQGGVDDRGYISVTIDSVTIIDTLTNISYSSCRSIVDSVIFWRSGIETVYNLHFPQFYEGESTNLAIPGEACHLPGVSVTWSGPRGFQSNESVAPLLSINQQSAGTYTYIITDSVCGGTSSGFTSISVIPANVVRDSLYWVDVQMFGDASNVYAIRSDGTLWAKQGSFALAEQSFAQLDLNNDTYTDFYLISQDSTWSHFVDGGGASGANNIYAEKRDGSIWCVREYPGNGGVGILSETTNRRHWRKEAFNTNFTLVFTEDGNSYLSGTRFSPDNSQSIFPASAKKWMDGSILNNAGFVLLPGGGYGFNHQTTIGSFTLSNVDGYASVLDYDYGYIDGGYNGPLGYASIRSDSTMSLTFNESNLNYYSTKKLNTLKWRKFMSNSLLAGSVSAIGTDGFLKRVPLHSNYAGKPFPSSGSLPVSRTVYISDGSCQNCGYEQMLYYPLILPYTNVTATWSNMPHSVYWQFSVRNAVVHLNGKELCLDDFNNGMNNTECFRLPFVNLNFSPLGNNQIASSATICSGTLASLTGTIPTGGTGTYSYDWLSSSSSSGPWGIVSGQTAQQFNLSGLTQNVYLRRLAFSATARDSGNVAQVLVNSSITGNSIITSSTICSQSGNFFLTGNIPSGGNGGFQYVWESSMDTLNWIPMGTASSQVVASQGYYRRKVSSTQGICQNISNVSSVQSLQPIVSITSPTQSICQGDSLVLTASGATTYLWSTGSTASTLQVSNAGTYQVIGTDQNGCTDTAQTVVTVRSTPVASISPSGTIQICSTNTQTLTGSGGSAYVWNTGSTQSSIQVNTAGSYQLTVTDSLGCQGLSNVVWIQTVAPAVLSASSNSPVCAGAQLNLSATQHLSHSYQWMGPNGYSASGHSPSITNATVSATGIYTVFMSDSLCGTQSATVSVQVNQGGMIQASSNSPVCAGGSLQLSANGPTGQYVWSGPNGFTASGMTASISSVGSVNNGVYFVNGTSSNGCTLTPDSVVVSIGVLPSVQISPSGFTSHCSGNSTLLTSSGATTYLWSTGSTASTLQVSNAGTYQVIGTDQNGCTGMAQTVVTVRSAPVASISPSGTIQICTTGNQTLTGSAASAYLWNNGSTQSSIQVNTAGSYQLTVTDSLGCQGVSNVVWVQTVAPAVLSVSSNSPVCAGAQLNLSATQHLSHTYQWYGPNGYSASGHSHSITNASVSATGIYTVFMNDSLCGTQSATVSVQINQAGMIQASSNSPVCAGGSLQLSANGPTGQYVWSGPMGFTASGMTASISSVGSVNNGVYLVYGMSPNGCTLTPDSVVVSIGVLPSVQISPSGFTSHCSGDSTLLTASGATTYLWSTGSTASSIQVSNAGTYQVIGTDQNGCTDTAQTVVTVRSAPVASISPSGTIQICTTGNQTLTGSGGSAYVWNTGATQSSIQVSTAGSYQLTVTDSLGCQGQSNVVWIQTVAPAVLSASSNSPVTAGNALNLSATDILNAIYQWTGPAGFSSTLRNPVISSAALNQAGVYTVVMTDPICGTQSSTVTVQVQQPQNCAAPVATSNSPVCESNPVYLNTPSITGATYSWQGPNGFSSSVQNASLSNGIPSMSGIYTLTVVSPICGTATTQIPVTVGGTLNGSNAINNGPLCSGAQLNLSGSTVPNGTYSWSGPGGFTSNLQVANRLNTQTNQGGIYTVVISSPGCGSTTRTTSVAVNSGTGPNAGSNSPVCQGNAIYLSSSNLSGGIYSWTGPNNFSSNVQFPSVSNAQSIHSGVYTLISTVPGCGAVSNVVSVVVNSPLTSLSVTSNSPVCSGNTLQLSSTSQTGYQFNWSGPSGFVSTLGSPAITNSTSGNSGVYTVIVISPGCGSTTRNISATVISAPVVSVGSNSPVCQNGAIFLTSSSHTGASYSWSGPNGFVSSLPSPTILTAQSIHSGTYSLTVTVPACAAVQATASVSVSPITSGASLLNNGPLCTGQTLNLSANGLSNGVTYSWTGPNGFTSNLSHPTLTGFDQVNAGVYSLSVSSPGCATTNYTTSVSHLPALVAVASVNSPVCSGSSVTLSTQNIVGVSYLWEGPNGFSSNQASPLLSNVQTTASGVYTLTLTRSGCGSSSTTVSLMVGAGYGTVTVQSNSPMCTGTTLSVTATDAPGTTKLWTAPDGFTTSSANFTRSNMSPTEAGVYTYSISSPGCGTTTRVMSVVVNSPPTVNPGSNSPVCQGNALYLSTNTISGVTYAWSGPNGFASTAQNPSISNSQPAASGVYSLMVTSSGCGVVSSTTAVSIGSNPATVVATSNSPVCSGLNLNLSGTVLSNLTYVWSGPGGFTSNQAQPTLAGVNSGNAGVYTLQASSAGCASVTRLHTVVVSNLTITPGSNSPICQGAALMFTTNAVSGASYSWSGPNGFVSTIQNPSISIAQPVRTGIYTLTVSSSSCGTTTATTSVLVGSNTNSLSLTSNSPVCTGNNLNLSITNRTGFIFNWTGPNGFTSNVATPVINSVTGAAAGRYTVVVVSAGCGTATVQSSNIIVNNVGTVSASSTSPVCLGAPIYFTGIAPAGSTYRWSGPSGFISTIQNPSRNNAQLSHAGVYTMTATVTGCGSITTTTTLVVNPCRSAEDNTSNLDAFLDHANWTVEVYPNPTEGKTKVRITGWKGELPTLRVLDLLGHEILIQGVQETIQGELSWILDFRGISKGVYFISIQTEQGERVERVVVQ